MRVANLSLTFLPPDVAYAPMTGPGGPWGDLPPAEYGDLAYSYGVFRDLRKKGIRSHSWP